LGGTTKEKAFRRNKLLLLRQPFRRTWARSSSHIQVSACRRRRLPSSPDAASASRQAKTCSGVYKKKHTQRLEQIRNSTRKALQSEPRFFSSFCALVCCCPASSSVVETGEATACLGPELRDACSVGRQRAQGQHGRVPARSGGRPVLRHRQRHRLAPAHPSQRRRIRVGADVTQ
jgi:hypothetical protein